MVLSGGWDLQDGPSAASHLTLSLYLTGLRGWKR